MDEKKRTEKPSFDADAAAREVSAEAAFGTAIAGARATWGLTPRQADVLLGIVRGLTNKEVAANLGCQESTVEAHMARTLRKSGCQNRVMLATQVWLLHLRWRR